MTRTAAQIRQNERIKLGNTIRVWRQHREMTQTEMAEALEIQQSNLSVIENGRKLPNDSTIDKLAKVLKITPYDLLSGVLPTTK
jgi:transcriptional regulator with XRE-family HTH domain